MVESTLNVPSFKSHFAVDKIFGSKRKKKRNENENESDAMK
jgi:hypothetical protein